MYSGATQSLAPSNGDRREPIPLTSAAIALALDRSPDGGVTLVLSKLHLSDVSAEVAEKLATVGRIGPEDESIIERVTLGNNRLTTLPTEFALLSRLRYLNLKHNNLSSFPDVLTVMPVLDTLDISHNKIKRFPVHPGRLIDLRVFSFSKNKVTRLPSYLPQFKQLEILKLDRNPFEWPPRSVLQSDASHDGEKEMKEWIAHILDWVDYNTSLLKIHDDSGYSETLDLDSNGKQDKHKAWRFPLHEPNGEPTTPLFHSRTYSVDSQASISSLLDDSLIEVDSTRTRSPAHFKRALHQPLVNSSDYSTAHLPEEYLSSPVRSEKFELHRPLPRTDVPDLNRAQPLHLRALSVATEQRPPSSVSGKNSLPDLRSPQWSMLSQSPEQSFSDFIGSQPEPNRPAPAARYILTSNGSGPQRGNSTRATPSMAFERNSYFQRLSTMPMSLNLPAPLSCLVETARSILFVTSQIYQTIEHYANHAVDEKHSSIFKRLLEPANTDMVQLIQTLDRFDTSSRKSLPSPPICRAIAETCRNTVIATGKAVGMFAIQLRVAPCEDHRYSRWILLELYASTAEVSVAWQNLLPHMQALKLFLHSKLPSNAPLPPLLQAPPFGLSSTQSRQSDDQYPAPRLRNADLISLRTHNARRHAGSFSYRDVELGKVLPSIDEPPSLSGGVAGQFPTLRTPKRQATAPLVAPALNGSVSLPGPQPPAFSLSRSEGSLLTRHSREQSYDQPLRSAPTNYSAGPRLKSLDLPANLRPKQDRETLYSIRQIMDSAPRVWDMIDDATSPSDTLSKELIKKGRDLSRKFSSGLRAMDNDKVAEHYLSETVQLLLKLLAQISSLVKSGTLPHSASPTLLAHLVRLTESVEEFKMRNASFLSSSSSQLYSPLFPDPFNSPSNMEDNRLTSSLSRTRSAQPTPSLKASISSFHDSPRSALPTATFKIPTINRGRSDLIDPG